jgi:hypothetical protein
MRRASKLLLAVAFAALLASGFAACGSEDSTDSTAPARQGTTAPATTESGDSGSTAFRTPGGDNSVQNFGEEADAAEAEAASATLASYMRARAEDDWAKQCATLAQLTIEPLQQLASRSPQLKGKDCAAILTALIASTPRSTRVDTMTDGIASLRVEGDRGFALYHGAEGVDYFVPMVKEGGEWKVGALAPTEFP